MDLLQLKRGSLSKWLEVNPILAVGEPGVIFDNKTALPIAFVIGNGTTPFKELPLFSQSSGNTEQYVLPVATKETLGGVKSGTAGEGVLYEVEIGLNGVPFVKVPLNDAQPVDAYTKEESDGRYSTKESTQNAQNTANEARTAASSAQNTANNASSLAQTANETANSAKSLAESNKSNLNNLSAVALRSNVLGQNKVVITGVKTSGLDLVFTTVDLVSGASSEINFTDLLNEDVLSNAGIMTDSKVTQKISAITDPISVNVSSNAKTLGELSGKISSQATSENKVLSKSEIETLISSNKGRQISLQNGAPFPTYLALQSGPWYYGLNLISTTSGLISGDTATVLADETQENSTTSYQWNGETWAFKSKTNASFTPEQEAALSSGITAEKVSKIESDIQENSEKIQQEASDREASISEASAAAALALENHNKSSSSHSDIREELARVKALAEGKSKGESYNDISSMVNSLNSLPSNALNAGSNIFILAKDVPDFWVYQVASESVPYPYVDDIEVIDHFKKYDSLQIGYYIISISESDKVDLSGVQLKYLTETLQINGQNVTTVEGALKQLNTLATGANSSSVEAKSIAENASAAAEQAKTVANQVDAKATDAISVSGQAKTSAESAQTAASEALSKSDESKFLANEAKTSAESAQTAASEARGIAQTAVENATAAQTVANQVQNDLNDYKTLAGNSYTSKIEFEALRKTVGENASDLNSLKLEDTAIKERIQTLENAQSSGMTRQIVDSLPDPSDASRNIIYCIRNTSTDGTDFYNEFWLVGEGDSARLEFIGNSKTSLDGYVTEKDLSDAINGIKHSVFFTEKLDLSTSDLDAIDSYFELNPGKRDTLKQNDVFIISTVSNDVVYERSAYIYDTSDGDPGWVSITGHVDAEKVILKENLILAGNYTQIGNITKSSTGTKTLETKGKSVLDVIKMFTTKIIKPGDADWSKTNPSVSLSISSPSTRSLEKGSTENVQYSISFDSGSYKFGPSPTGSSVTKYRLNNVEVNSSGSMSVLFDTDKEFIAMVDYTDANVPYDNMGEVDDAYSLYKIQSGEVLSSKITITVYTASFIKFDPNDILFGNFNSANIRSYLNNTNYTKSQLTNGVTISNISDAKTFAIAVPSSFGFTSCKVINNDTTVGFGTASKIEDVLVADARNDIQYSSKYTIFYIKNTAAAEGKATYKITLS